MAMPSRIPSLSSAMRTLAMGGLPDASVSTARGQARCPAMERTAELVSLLGAHAAADESEARSLEAMRAYAKSLAEPFSRKQPEAHFTGSAVVVDPEGERVCLVHHKKLGRWLQPGGHADVEDGGRMEVTALREAREETGCDVTLHP